MTDPAALEARKRELLAEVERIDAQLAEPEPPVEEALREALKGDLRLTYHERVVWSNGFRDGYAAALPLAPLPRAAMGEREIAEIADLAIGAAKKGAFSPTYQAVALAAIRATLRRVPGWPGEKPEPQWIDWHGGECPVPAGTRVEAELRPGDTIITTAGSLEWGHTEENMGCFEPISRYRIIGDPA